ncbi:hypothetical protein DPMN_091794 [Dreissena polymorpha]|uniref:Uncharacterized protein n=1 Tax=Dreissena polymorpha TaxID=45954 RepID=A0A9D4L057_DREPO|nr:hypothetical protein DPMN_091794 [Dreissena polymorpha]
MDFFEDPCPIGCLQSVCLNSVGWISCQAGWCKLCGDGPIVCTPQYPRGQNCSSWGFCTRDRN